MSRRQDEGTYSITSLGVDTSSATLGSAISKAQTIAVRVQRELKPDEEVRSIYIRMLGKEDVAARLDVHRHVILTFPM